MKARALIDGASFGPATLKVVGQAFDQAWDEIKGTFSSEPVVVEGARMSLANAVLSVAHEDSRDVGELKRGALEAMAQSYGSRIGKRSPKTV